MSGPYSNLTATDYLSAAQKLLPQGAAWDHDPRLIRNRYFSAIANVIWLGHKALANLFDVELDPTQADDLLPDWEAAFGLIARGSKASRRLNLVAAIADPGGYSSAHYVALAASIGIVITTVVTAPYTWEVHAPASLSAGSRKTLETLITLQNRVTCALTFVYDLGVDLGIETGGALGTEAGDSLILE